MLRSFSKTLFASLFAACLISGAFAQNYPTKPVRILSGLTPGGPGDIAVRGAAQVLQQALAQPFVIENRVGADGIIAGEACVKAPADGYTLCAGDSYMFAMNPVIRKHMPYDPARDMVPVALLGYLPAAILASSSVPANSLAALFDTVRAKPKSVGWASFGLASASHLYIEWLKNEKNLVFLDVPYKTAAQAFQALLAGEVQVAVFSTGQSASFIKAGKIKALAVNTDRRLPNLPDVPTFREAGLDIPIITWFGITAPAGTPKDAVQRINAEVGKGLVMNPAARAQFLDKAGVVVLPPAGESAEAFAAMLQRERQKYAALVKAAGVTVE